MSEARGDPKSKGKTEGTRRRQTDRSVSGILGSFIKPQEEPREEELRNDEGDVGDLEEGNLEEGNLEEEARVGSGASAEERPKSEIGLAPGSEEEIEARSGEAPEIAEEAPTEGTEPSQIKQGGDSARGAVAEDVTGPEGMEEDDERRMGASRDANTAADISGSALGRTPVPEVPEVSVEGPEFETNPAVSAMERIVTEGKERQVPKQQKGYELPEGYEWALQDIRRHMMRVERFTAREASASNCVAAAVALYYQTLFGGPIDSGGGVVGEPASPSSRTLGAEDG